jgi:hypothetical protein
MAITKGEKMALWVTGAIVFAVIVWAWVMRRESLSTSNEENYNSPYYMNYNYPLVSWNAGGSVTGTASGLPSIPAANAANNDCGCGGGTNGFYTSLSQMLSSFQQGAENAFNSYESNIRNSFPSYVDQYINNPASAAQAANVTQVLG